MDNPDFPYKGYRYDTLPESPELNKHRAALEAWAKQKLADGLNVQTHELKIWPKFFEDIIERRKTYEIRVNDRNFQVGDINTLREWDPSVKMYTGRFCQVRIVHLTDASHWYMIPVHLVVYGIELMP